MGEFTARAASGKILNQASGYNCRSRRSQGHTVLEGRESNIFEDGKDSSISEMEKADEPGVTNSAAARCGVTNEQRLPQITNSSIKQEADESHVSPPSGSQHFETVHYRATSRATPLTASYAEVFTFVNKADEVSAGLSLTKVMLCHFNAVYHGEQKIMGYLSRINSNTEQLRMIGDEVDDINEQLQDLLEDYQDEPVLVQAVLQLQQEVEMLTQLREELSLEMRYLENDIEKEQNDIQQAKNQLFVDLKDILAAGGLLEPYVEEIPMQIPSALDANTACAAQTTPTLSEIERYAMEEARDAALNDFTEKTIQVQDAQERFDRLPDHYNKQYDNYLVSCEAGTITTTKSEFDLAMLLDSRDATTMLIQAERELEQARNHARELGLTLDSYDQESCFVDFPDDGYRESLENEWIAFVDRNWIERWMEQEDNTLEEAHCDEWESKTVDISDSISAIADTFKSRKRIGYWRAMCKALDINTHVETDTE
jgi:predicted  nucleic acid-binding Zn-ribbon protein